MEFSASLEHLAEIMVFIHDQLTKLGIDRKLCHKIELACEEAIVNIIFYAYPEKKGTLAVQCEKKGSRLEILLQDHGIPFNPVDVDVNPQTNVPVEDRKVGGLGIFLLRKIIDEASYQREEEVNILRLAFRI